MPREERPFRTAEDATAFLASSIIALAARDGVELSNVERRMLLFSEINDQPFDRLELSNAFDAECNQDEYEQKIAHLVQNFRSYSQAESPQQWQLWKTAVQRLKGEDFYINVLTSIAPADPAPEFPFMRVVLLGMALTLSVLVAILIYKRITTP